MKLQLTKLHAQNTHGQQVRDARTATGETSTEMRFAKL